MLGAMRDWLQRLPHFVIIDVAINHYLYVSSEGHNFDYEVDDLCRPLDQQEDSSLTYPYSLDLDQSYYCIDFDLLLVFDLSLVVAGSSFCFKAMSAVRPRKQSVTSSSTWASFLISADFIMCLLSGVRSNADSQMIRSSIARKDSVTLY